MTARGAATRRALLQATTQVVREVGYAHATTKAIAEAAGVSEGTIYRHFPNKLALFFTALLEQNSDVVQELEALPAKAGTGSVEDNLVATLARLAQARDDVLPLELAMLTNPELAEQRDSFNPDQLPDAPTPPPVILAQYLRAEQGLGRLRRDIDPDLAAGVLLVTLFGLSIRRPGQPGPAEQPLLAAAVRMYTSTPSDRLSADPVDQRSL